MLLYCTESSLCYITHYIIQYVKYCALLALLYNIVSCIVKDWIADVSEFTLSEAWAAAPPAAGRSTRLQAPRRPSLGTVTVSFGAGGQCFTGSLRLPLRVRLAVPEPDGGCSGVPGHSGCAVPWPAGAAAGPLHCNTSLVRNLILTICSGVFFHASGRPDSQKTQNWGGLGKI